MLLQLRIQPDRPLSLRLIPIRPTLRAASAAKRLPEIATCKLETSASRANGQTCKHMQMRDNRAEMRRKCELASNVNVDSFHPDRVPEER